MIATRVPRSTQEPLVAEPTPVNPNGPRPVPLVPRSDRERLGAPLPTLLSSFVGREHELASVVDLLRRDNVRLLTLTGPGGVGKTRLAIRAAEEVAAEFTDGVAFVPLASITNHGLVVPTIAQTLGV